MESAEEKNDREFWEQHNKTYQAHRLVPFNSETFKTQNTMKDHADHLISDLTHLRNTHYGKYPQIDQILREAIASLERL